MVVGPDWKGETPPGIKKVFRSTTQFSVAGFRTQLFNPDDLERQEGAGRLQGADAFRISRTSRRPARIAVDHSRKSTKNW